MENIKKINNGFLEMAENNRKRNLIACLKTGEKAWKQYMNTPSKTGQLASKYLKRFKTINSRFQEQISQLVIKDNNDLQKVKEIRVVFEGCITQLERKAKKYLEHEAEMKLINMKSGQAREVEESQEEEIKEEMLDLVEKFKKYAVDIQEDLEKDNDVIDEINFKQDKQLTSLKTKSQTLKEIIKDQKIGFFQLVAMGIIAIALWIFGLFIILII